MQKIRWDIMRSGHDELIKAFLENSFYPKDKNPEKREMLRWVLRWDGPNLLPQYVP